METHKEFTPDLNTQLLLGEIRRAQDVVRADESPVLPTRVFRDDNLSEQYDADVWLVSELHQPIGAYKIRGGYYALASLTAEEKSRGVVTASAGNHAQAVALSAAAEAVSAQAYVPKNTPEKKLEKLKALCNKDVRVVVAGETFDEAYGLAKQEQGDRGATFVEPFNDLKVIAGQGTLGVELLEHLPNLEAVLVPVGGGGLASGVATVAKNHNPDLFTVGVEPLHAASMQAAILRGEPVTLDERFDTFVDGAAVKRVGNLTHAIASRVLDSLVAVDNGELRRVVTNLWERSDPVKAELAGALAISGLSLVADQIKGRQVACIVSGGNLSHERFERDVRVSCA